MRNILIIIGLLYSVVGLSQTNQDADPNFVSLSQDPEVTNVGGAATITARVTNSGTDPIVENGVIVTVSWSSLYEYTGFKNSMETGFVAISTGDQMVQLRNVNNEIEENELETLDLRIGVVAVQSDVDNQGNAILQSITGQIQRSPGFANQVGNTRTGNDTAQGMQGVNEVALPVELVSFKVEAEGVNAKLEWVTATELSNSHFNVERSIDGTNWTKIARVEGIGTTEEVQRYSYTDVNAAINGQRLYYRLTQVDFDGASERSDIAEVDFREASIASSIYPNPAQGGEDVVIKGKGITTVNVYTSQAVLVGSYEQPAGRKMTIQTNELSSGTYVVVINDDRTEFLVVTK